MDRLLTALNNALGSTIYQNYEISRIYNKQNQQHQLPCIDYNNNIHANKKNASFGNVLLSKYLYNFINPLITGHLYILMHSNKEPLKKRNDSNDPSSGNHAVDRTVS